MAAPTLGITIVIILVFTTLTQLLLQASNQRKRHEEIRQQLDRIETLMKK